MRATKATSRESAGSGVFDAEAREKQRARIDWLPACRRVRNGTTEGNDNSLEEIQSGQAVQAQPRDRRFGGDAPRAQARIRHQMIILRRSFFAHHPSREGYGQIPRS